MAIFSFNVCRQSNEFVNGSLPDAARFLSACRNKLLQSFQTVLEVVNLFLFGKNRRNPFANEIKKWKSYREVQVQYNMLVLSY